MAPTTADPPVVLCDTHLVHEFPEELDRIREAAPSARLVVAGDDHDLMAALPDAVVLIAPPQSEERLATAHRLRAHVIPFAGVNRVPVRWYRERGVILANSHGNAPAVAERAVALMYAAAGRVVEFDNDLRQGRWHRNPDIHRPFDYWRSLSGGRVAIIGGGAIGSRIAALVEPLAGTIEVSRRGGDPWRVVADADVVFLAVPLTPETRGMVSRAVLQRTRQAILVNVGRAEVVPEEDLYRALTDGTISAAGLDVWYRAPDPFWAEGADAMPSSAPFHLLSNVVMSPHAGSHSRAGKQGQLRAAVARAVEFLTTGTIAAAVDLSRGY